MSFSTEYYKIFKETEHGMLCNVEDFRNLLGFSKFRFGIYYTLAHKACDMGKQERKDHFFKIKTEAGTQKMLSEYACGLIVVCAKKSTKITEEIYTFFEDKSRTYYINPRISGNFSQIPPSGGPRNYEFHDYSAPLFFLTVLIIFNFIFAMLVLPMGKEGFLITMGIISIFDLIALRAVVGAMIEAYIFKLNYKPFADSFKVHEYRENIDEISFEVSTIIYGYTHDFTTLKREITEMLLEVNKLPITISGTQPGFNTIKLKKLYYKQKNKH